MPQSVKHEIVYPIDSKSRKGISSHSSLCEIGLSIQGSPKQNQNITVFIYKN